ncbi:hypothetical protein BGZ99_007509 [Dissophora globulifera]|uniref:Uncharacterized protein n=1 Tax=Dissophora globulifera TaxID=979702 RepID=A0A9P6RBX9_9FUNG|nr:hypothetical protein BGZ99_007509 [Dissophora globulifera]
MSEQPIYHSPAPGTVMPPPLQQGDGTSANHQYATPYQYAQPSPDQQQQQHYYAQSPVVQQQPLYAAQSPDPQPVYTQPQPVYAQPQPHIQAEAPTVVYAQELTTTQVPVITGNGKGLTGRLPQVDNCCACLPLHTGAMVVAFIMFIFYGWCGLGLILGGSEIGGYGAFAIVIGVLYILVAVVSLYGLIGIYKEEVAWVDRFVRMFVIGSLVWVVLYIIEIIVLATQYGAYIAWGSTIVQLILGFLFQYYFCICLVSYQRVLHARVGDQEKQIPMQ